MVIKLSCFAEAGFFFFKLMRRTARYTSFVKSGQVTDPDTGETIIAGYIDRTFYTKERKPVQKKNDITR